MSANEISALARWGLEQAGAGKMTREMVLYLLASIDGKASDILRLLERNGAPTRPIDQQFRPPRFNGKPSGHDR